MGVGCKELEGQLENHHVLMVIERPGKMKQHMTHRSKDVDSSRFHPQFFLVLSVRYTHSCIISNIRKLPAQIHYVKEKII